MSAATLAVGHRFAAENPGHDPGGEAAVNAATGDLVRGAPETTGRRAEPQLVVGVGCSLGCPADELAALVEDAVAGLGGAVVAVATVDRRADESCVTALAAAFGVPVRSSPAAALAAVPVPTPSPAVERHVGTPSVAEAAALLASGGDLVVTKRRSAHATCAIAQEPAWPA